MSNVKSSEIGDLGTIAVEHHRTKGNHVKLLVYNKGTGSEVRSWVSPALQRLVHVPTLFVPFMDIHTICITLLNIYSYGAYCVIVILLNTGGGGHKIRDGDFLNNLHTNGMIQAVRMPNYFPGTLKGNVN